MRRSNRRHAHLKVIMSADRLELSIALSDNENTRPILDGDVTAHARIVRAPYFTHAAFTDAGEEFVLLGRERQEFTVQRDAMRASIDRERTDDELGGLEDALAWAKSQSL